MENYDIDVWAVNLVGQNHEVRFEGSKLPNEHLVFKTATRSMDATGTHIVELTSINGKSEEVKANICTLNDQDSNKILAKKN